LTTAGVVTNKLRRGQLGRSILSYDERIVHVG
jgi:hypothetical protein